ncbi:hypothetical protein WA026_015816 [Henosepilachna vigintioctopunctata]|uniref:Beta-hexosaminidase n=1 Tax=Henosepilachna vigintioctopunctata TaxID=420089 RepID=A0AAW1V2K1_9CUCU
MLLLELLLVFQYILGITATILLPITPTKGGVVPLPQKSETYRDFFVIRPSVFRFKVTGYSCSILDEATIRYWILISESFSYFDLEKKSQLHKKIWKENVNYLGLLDSLSVHLENDCTNDEMPHLHMNENYTIQLDQTQQVIRSSSVWGILRGLETFSQLIYKADDTYTLIVNSTKITDFPRFSHRGLLLDTARHFIPMRLILKTLDAMSFNKLNVFHWHIVDDQSFPYKSSKFPDLSDKGAYHPEAAVYNPEDVEKVISYARKRGIRVVVEFDTPGHTLSWGNGIKNILTECVGIADKFGPMDPSKPKLYQFLNDFFQEISEVFPERYVHLGGDEVPFDCWESNPNISQFMKSLNLTDYSDLEGYYINKLIDLVTKKKLNSIVWEEVFDNGVELSDSTIVHVWKGDFNTTLYKVTEARKKALLSSCWYLDHLGGVQDWINYYRCDPYDFSGSDEQKNLILGGEACMWSEAVNEYNVMSRVWPRACAAAEKLWSSITPRDNTTITPAQIENMGSRLEEHTCRMNRRGIEAEPPNWPSYCY